MGLYSDCYYLQLSSTIFDLMGFKSSEETDEVFNEYIEMAEKTAIMDITESNKEMEKMAVEIYEKLLRSIINTVWLNKTLRVSDPNALCKVF